MRPEASGPGGADGGEAKKARKGGKPLPPPHSAAPYIDRVLVPGDHAVDLHSLVAAEGARKGGAVLRLGSGLRQEGSHVVAMRAGVLRAVQGNKFWLETSCKRYTPAVEEEVLGVIVEKHAENFDVDIRGPSLALLPVLAFESATRRNRPNLDIGASVYARIVRTHPDAPPELACTDASGRASGFGPLVGGFIFECSTGLARTLLSNPQPGVLEALGSSVSFELAVGLNGRVWVNGETTEMTILVANAIQASEGKTTAQQHMLVRALLQVSKRDA